MARVILLLVIVAVAFLIILGLISYIDYRNKKREREMEKFKRRR
ncbi:MAG: hypothetical protein ABDH28_06695 [Brevinematia bacterium]